MYLGYELEDIAEANLSKQEHLLWLNVDISLNNNKIYLKQL